MSRFFRPQKPWDDGPPGAEVGFDRAPERPKVSVKAIDREGSRPGRSSRDYPRRSPSFDSDREVHPEKTRKAGTGRGESYCGDADYKNRNKKKWESSSRSVSCDSNKRYRDSKFEDKPWGRRKSSSRDQSKSRCDTKVRSKRRRKSYTSSSTSSPNSNNSRETSTSGSSDDSSHGCPPSRSRSTRYLGSHKRLPFRDRSHRSDSPRDSSSNKKDDKVPVPFKNDGSFLEIFKKMQDTSTEEIGPSSGGSVEITQLPKKPALPLIMKRRGGRLLKTGLVKKPKAIEEQHVDNTPKDAWSLYMQEVKKYRETSCEEEGKTRPLVK